MTIGVFNPTNKALWSSLAATQDKTPTKAECGFAEFLDPKPAQPKAPAGGAPSTMDATGIGLQAPEPDRLPYFMDDGGISEVPVVPTEEGPSSEVLLAYKLFFGEGARWTIDNGPDWTQAAKPEA